MADEQLYAAHEADPRPNPLFDAQGARLRLDPSTLDQENLRREWRGLYKAELARHKANTESKPASPPPASAHRPPDSAILPCQDKYWIFVRLSVRPDLKARPSWWSADRPVYAYEKYTASGACGWREDILDGGGSVRFTNISEGRCHFLFKSFYEQVELFFKRHLV